MTTQESSNLATIYTTSKEDQVHPSARHTQAINPDSWNADNRYGVWLLLWEVRESLKSSISACSQDRTRGERGKKLNEREHYTETWDDLPFIACVMAFWLISIAPWQSRLDHVRQEDPPVQRGRGTDDGSMMSTQKWGGNWSFPLPHFSFDYKTIGFPWWYSG